MKRLLFFIAVLIGFSQPLRAAPECCRVTAIDARTETATAVENATGRTFEFHVANAKLFATLRVGTPVYANFKTMQISLDGKTPGGEITKISPVPAAAAPPAGAPASRPATGAPGAVAPSSASRPPVAKAELSPQAGALKTSGLPQLSYGTPQTVASQQAIVPGPGGAKLARSQPHTVAGTTILHLRGLDGIEQAQGIPDGVKTMLLLHVRTLEAGQSDHYLVNPTLALEWSKTHPVPTSMKPSDSGDGHSGCSKWTWHCVSEAAKHAEDETSRQADDLRKQAQADWKKDSGELTKAWHEVDSCLADNTLALGNIPIEFAASPSIGIHLQDQGKTTFSGGSASGTAQGTVNLALPIKSPDFRANLEVFYIPCLPFMVRPKSISGHGTLTVGTKLTAAVKATGQFEETVSAGSNQTIVNMIPIVLFGVPIVELDVSVYVEGIIDVGGSGQFTANFELDNPHEMKLSFSCDGGGCLGSSEPVAVPTTAVESAQLNGRIHVKPMIYTAVQLDFDFDALSVRAGPQPYLLGELYGCIAGVATQNLSSGTSTAQDWHALTADVDWGMDLRAEALIGGKQVGPTLIRRLVSQDPPKHIAFWDLAHSTALLPQVLGPAQASMGAPALYKIKMPTCYPYTDKVKYQLAWTGSATASNATPGTTDATRDALHPAAPLKVALKGSPSTKTGPTPPCNLQAGQGICEFDPLKDLSLDLIWPAAGTYNLTVTAVGDTPHGRDFKSPQPTTVNVTVN